LIGSAVFAGLVNRQTDIGDTQTDRPTTIGRYR